MMDEYTHLYSDPDVVEMFGKSGVGRDIDT